MLTSMTIFKLFFLIYIVLPEVQVMASRQRVNIGASVTLSCSVNRTNPEVSTHVWTTDSGGIIMVGENITLTFSSTNDFGTYRCTVNNTAGFSRTDSVTIEQGCKLKDINTCTTLYLVPIIAITILL